MCRIVTCNCPNYKYSQPNLRLLKWKQMRTLLLFIQDYVILSIQVLTLRRNFLILKQWENFWDLFPKRFIPKVTSTEKSKDINSLRVHELFGSLPTKEMSLLLFIEATRSLLKLLIMKENSLKLVINSLWLWMKWTYGLKDSNIPRLKKKHFQKSNSTKAKIIQKGLHEKENVSSKGKTIKHFNCGRLRYMALNVLFPKMSKWPSKLHGVIQIQVIVRPKILEISIWAKL